MTDYTSRRKIGVLYLPSEGFLDEANQTIGEPIIGQNMEQLVENRRKVTSRLTDLGKNILGATREYFLATYGVEVLLRWNIRAGCSCPCSPGFVIHVNTQALPSQWRYPKRIQDAQEINIWGEESGRLFIRLPKYAWNMPLVQKVPDLVGLA